MKTINHLWMQQNNKNQARIRPPMGHAMVMNAIFFDFSTLVFARLPKSSKILLADILFFFLSRSRCLSAF